MRIVSSERACPSVAHETFARLQIAPSATMLLNAAYWEEGCPRILTTAELAQVQKEAPAGKFLAVVDVGCDWGVSGRRRVFEARR